MVNKAFTFIRDGSCFVIVGLAYPKICYLFSRDKLEAVVQVFLQFNPGEGIALVYLFANSREVGTFGYQFGSGVLCGGSSSGILKAAGIRADCCKEAVGNQWSDGPARLLN